MAHNLPVRSGHRLPGTRDGNTIGMMLLGMTSFVVVCHPPGSSSNTACAPFATWRDISSIWMHHLGIDTR
jgi:hypothetical protein